MPSRSDFGPTPRLGYVPNALDRTAHLRGDAAALAALQARADARVYVCSGELVVMKAAAGPHEPLFTLEEAWALGAGPELVFLGRDGEAPRFGAVVPSAEIDRLKARGDLLLRDLRSIAVQGLVPPHHLAPLAQAKALLLWHARRGFCSNCGSPTIAVHGGWRRDCPACKAQHFPRTDPVVIMLTIDGDRCLLGRQSRFAPGMWSCLAGFVEPGETVEEAVLRETREETGIVCGSVTYFATQPWPFPMSLMIGCHSRALTTEITVDHSELEAARWFPRDEVVAMLRNAHPHGLTTPPPVAIAYHIIRTWLERGDDVFR
ncbi:MAG TPA: NAD(+) diphosphatase [Xanthobacteraceae bacterium]|nr:NAD(+) diphosphatase [Xanthobacteraceae bacterium]